MEAHRKSAFDIIMTTIITLICVTVAFFIIQDLVAPKEKGLETQMADGGASKTVNVEVESASRGSVVSHTKLYGDIVTDTVPVTLYSDVSGKVTSILIARGDRVEKGDVIAYVDQSRPGYSYQESRQHKLLHCSRLPRQDIRGGALIRLADSRYVDKDGRHRTGHHRRRRRSDGRHVRHDRPRDGPCG